MFLDIKKLSLLSDVWQIVRKLTDIPRGQRRLFYWCTKRCIVSLNVFICAVALSRSLVVANIAIEWLTLMFYVSDVSDSKLIQETGNPD